ncbi:MAG: ATP-binding protein [Candidatus Andersenbacteria bacterium]
MYILRLLEEELKKSFDTSKVLLLLGARQVGKTTLVEHALSERRGALLNMDIEVDRARFVAAAQLAPQDAIRALGGEDVLVIDEAHRVADVGRICKGWYDAHVTTKIILLGSSSATLLDTAAAELTGRNEKLWLTPLLFRETLAQQTWFTPAYTATELHTHFDSQIRSSLLNRLVFGSYPEAFLSSDPSQYLTNLTSDYLLKDIFTASLVRSPEDIRRLLLELAKEIGNTVSVLQLATRLNISRQTVQKYLDLLEAIFVIFSLPAYATDPIKEITKTRKYYFWDTGVKNALQREWVVSDKRSDIDTLWENWVMAEIWKQGRTYNRQEDLFFWQSRNDSTVDLVVKQGNKLYPFDIHFNSDEKRPSRSFINTYNIVPTLIHPGTILTVI